MPEVKTNLGRGLAALLGDDFSETQDYASLDKIKSTKHVPIEFLHPGRYQPRTKFDDGVLNGLVESIRDKGILQPLLVRRHPDRPNQYEIVAGERRWRASQLAGLHEVPVIVRDLGDLECLQVSLIENIQRENLSALEEAEGYQRLMDEFGHTQEEVSESMGKSRSHVANMLRILTLPPSVREYIHSGELSAGHARAIVNAKNPLDMARQIIRKGLNVRQAEKLVRFDEEGASTNTVNDNLQKIGKKLTKDIGDIKGAALAEDNKDPNTIILEKSLSEAIGMKVSIHQKGTGGMLTIQYETLDQLDEVIQKLRIKF